MSHAALRSAIIVLAVIAGTAGRGLGQDADLTWPREVKSSAGTIVVYTPQVDSFNGDSVSARAAIAVTPKGRSKMIFGAIWIQAHAAVDRDSRIVTLTNGSVPVVKLPGATQAQIDSVARILEGQLNSNSLSLPLDKLIAALESTSIATESGSGFKTDPPKIIVVNFPAVLIPVDGIPKMRKVEGYNIEEAENTPFFVVRDIATGAYYIKGGPLWYKGTLDGDKPSFELVDSAPSEVLAYYRSIASEEDLAADTSTVERAKAPRLLFTQEPAELISYDGKPDLQPIKGTELLYLYNSEEDVFVDIPSQRYFALFSGRWFTAAALEGPWAYVPADNLPRDFQKIPPDSPKGHVLASVGGTQEAREAVLENQIPQTASVSIDSTKAKVTYDGTPKFEQIPGTEMTYAINTQTAVIFCTGAYYACDNGVWFVGPAPEGPWTVCTVVPASIYTIPPSCPVYPVTYVRIYSYTPTVVVVGYTPGYCGSYVYGPTVIYGTGYVYPAWYGTYYYPRPVTYGFNFHYNPWTGWSMGFTVGSVGPGGWFSVSVGGGWWGPPVYRPPYAYRPVPYHRPPPYYRPPYAQRPPTGGRPTTQPARPTTLPSRDIYANRPGTGVRPTTPQARPQPAGPVTPSRPATKPSTRPNDLYADPQGNVYRKSDKGWQERTSSGWSQPDRSAPTAGQTDRSNRQKLDQEASARQRGTQRYNDYQRARQPSSGRPSGSARAGGGRRR